MILKIKDKEKLDEYFDLVGKLKKLWSMRVDFVVSADCRLKIKESKKRDKYLDLARELRKLWNMKVTVISIANGTLATVLKGSDRGLKELEIGGQIETIQTAAMLRTARRLRRLAAVKNPFIFTLCIFILYIYNTCISSDIYEGRFFLKLEHKFSYIKKNHSLYIYIYIYIYISFFFIIQYVKAHAMPCPHPPPTRGDNTVSVAQGGTATPRATKQLLPSDRVLRELYIYIYIYIYIYTRQIN